jgi:DNA replication licensing factor MCM2
VNNFDKCLSYITSNFSDYRRMETLDRYDTRMLDERNYEDMDVDTRRLVEEELNRRDAREGRIAQVFQEDQERTNS